MTAIHYEKNHQGIVTLTLDDPNQSTNTMNEAFRSALVETIHRIEQERDSIRGIILASAKRTFFAGGDLRELITVSPEQAEAFQQMLTNQITAPLRKLETFGVPVVAAINGSALGGGWELCLACHYRIVVDDHRIELGLPEVTLGLLPGGGGTTRMPRLLGLEKALPYLMEGKKLRPQKALKAGLVDALVDTREDLIPAAIAWIEANPNATQPWDTKGYKMPGGTPDHPKVARMLAIAPAILRNKTKGCYPAPEAILSAMVEGAQVDFDTALKIEARYFTSLVIGQIAKNMIGTFWFQLNAIKSGDSRPGDIPPHTVRKVGILGAGMMGAGIAYACATRGIDVVLKDVSLEKAVQGQSYTDKRLSDKVRRGHMSENEKNEIVSKILPTDSVDALEGCDLVIEAVFEDSALKADVTREAEAKLTDSGFFASNTSTIPITQLAKASARPDKFIGLHFFSPVDKMPLVEIIKGTQTSEETLAKAFDFVMQIRKTPIVVNDSRGFFTSRVFGTFVNEGVAMLAEGYSACSIENAALLAGMPVGPLALCDEVSLDLITHVRDQTRRDTEAEGRPYQPHPAEAVIDRMVTQFGRRGKAAGAGFYEYPSQGKKYLWPELKDHFENTPKARSADLETLKDRLLFIQAIETLRCLEEGVLESVKDANIGSIFGIGFAAWTGGTVQFINQYGLAAFHERANVLAEQVGERFSPPALLIDQIKSGTPFR